ncbi:ABC transporter substrate-binding protein [Mesorhizobium sp.]|uniref:ABC transporter substrate-binding protein n=1 Tax=Mesorhizobium sp. TaxID=1871066 RepID=UPI0025CCAF08|nr:ABC transporter substrate-binding protein [Mesorhizobium sp.]
MKHYLKLALLASCACLAVGIADAKTLRFAESQEISSMDPHAAREDFTLSLIGNVYEGLVRWNKDLKIEPALAESWETLSDTKWRFHLRKGVVFHNGDPFTADDVIFSFHRAGAPGSPFAGLLEPVAEVTKVDDYTVDMTLRRKYALLLNDFAGLYILDKKFQESIGAEKPLDLSTNTGGAMITQGIGTGPFKLLSREPDVKTVFVANDKWWDKREHNIDEIDYTPIKNNATRVAALLSGEVDFIRNVPPQDVDKVEKTPGMKIMRAPHLRTIFFGMDQQSKVLAGSGLNSNPLADVRVRKAIYQAIDIEGIKRSIMRGNSRPAAIMMAPELPLYDASLEVRFPYDPEASKALLKEAGYANGFTLPMDCPAGSFINDEQICQATVGMLAKVGIKAQLTLHTPVQMDTDLPAGKYSFYMLGWAGLPTIDAYNILSATIHTPTGDLGAWNPKGYSNARVDELIPQIGTEYDPAKRKAMISEVMKIHRDEVGKIMLHQQFLTWGMSDKVHAIVPADEYTRFWYYTMD